MTLFEKIVAGLARQYKPVFEQHKLHKVMIANRGTCAQLLAEASLANGLQVVIACTEEDVANFKFLREGQESSRFELAIITSPKEDPDMDPYINGKGIIAAALAHDCDGMVPGWGFLSENAQFSKDCAATKKITFVGPSGESIDQVGPKDKAKQLAMKLGINVAQGFIQGDDQELADFAAEIFKGGAKYPLLIKAKEGGGGKGQRLITEPPQSVGELLEILELANTEAIAFFKKGGLIAEQYIPRARHIEIQVARDEHGNVIDFGERDCSLQRRNQKVVEETLSSPEVGDIRLDNETRTLMRKHARDLANAVGYTGVGTVEFMVDEKGQFYFLEMNTRLQVEHPVTNEVHRIPETGEKLDLIDLQLRIANGDSIEFAKQYVHQGHAIEVRVLAEDIGADGATFGKLWDLVMPKASQNLKVECAFQPGDTVSSNYDSMMAKLIVWAATREEAIAQMIEAVESMSVSSQDVRLNKQQLLALLRSEEFQEGTALTSSIHRKPEIMAVDLKETETAGDIADKVGLYLATLATEELIPVPGRQTVDGTPVQFERAVPETDPHLDEADRFKLSDRQQFWNPIITGMETFLGKLDTPQTALTATLESELQAGNPITAFFKDLLEDGQTAWLDFFNQMSKDIKADNEEGQKWKSLFTMMKGGLFNWKEITQLGTKQHTFAIHLYTKMNDTALVTFIEGRDGQQSRIQDRIDSGLLKDLYSHMADVFGDAIYSFEADGGAVPDVQARFLGNLAFEFTDTIHETVKVQLTQMLLRAMNAVAYGNIPVNLLEGIVKAFNDHGIAVFRIFDCLNSIKAATTGSDAVKKAGGISQVAISFTVDDLSTPAHQEKYTLEYWKQKCDALIEAAKPDQLGFKDMASQLTPRMVGELTQYLVKKHPMLVVCLHPHNDSQLAPAVTEAFIKAGGHIHDCGFVGTHTKVKEAMSEADLAKVGVQQAGVEKLEAAWGRTFDYYMPFLVPPLDPVLAMISQIPGGQWANFHSQAVANGVKMGAESAAKRPWVYESVWEDVQDLKNRYPESECRKQLPAECHWIYTLTEKGQLKDHIDAGRAYIIFAYRLARKLMGDVPEVTPSSKVAGEIAIALTKIGKDGPDSALDKLIAEYATTPPRPHAMFEWLEAKLCADPKLVNWPDSALKYFQKDLGVPEEGADNQGFPKFRDKLLDVYQLEEFEDTLPEFDFKAARDELCRKTGQIVREEDVLFYGMFGDVYTGVLNNRNRFGPAQQLLPPHIFFDGLEEGQAVIITPKVRRVDVDVDAEQSFEIKLEEKTVVAHDNGSKDYKIKLLINGVERSYEFHTNPKAQNANEVGSPGSGKLLGFCVKEGDIIERVGQELVKLNIMKFGVTVTATEDMVGKTVGSLDKHLKGQNVLGNDRLVTLRGV